MTPWLRRLIPRRTGWIPALPLSLVVVVGALLSLRSHFMLRHDRELVEHSFEVIRAANQVLIGALDAETGQRGFLITGSPEFLMPYDQATSGQIPAALEQLTHLVGDNSRQLELIGELEEVVAAKLGELAASVSTRQTQGFEAARLQVAARGGKDSMDRIRVVAQQVKASEEQLLVARSTEVRRDEQHIIAVIISTTLLSTFLRILIAAYRGHGQGAASGNPTRPKNR